jgi:aminoglycoside phosphotransferase family enzyme/predicted kinase
MIAGALPVNAGDLGDTAVQETLIAALQNPEVFDHPVGEISVLETHISWVILTGEFAYKIKKAVDFGFLDFSTLARRHYYCQEELRLNRRFAADLYLEVVSVTGSVDRPVLQGPGEPIEYAVKMRQFPQQDLLSNIVARHGLDEAHVDEIARLLADLHAGVDVADATTDYGRPDDIHHWVMENFEHIRPALGAPAQQAQLDWLEDWCGQEFRNRRELIQARRRDGFVRECHGDLHLGNLALIDGCITPFDCIEFNPQLRWIDVISEAAFLTMDLEDRGYPGLAYRFLNGYLQHSGDYAGVGLLRYYLVYRALVRAKVAVLRLGAVADDADASRQAREEYESYRRLARQYAQFRQPALIITHGVSGSGKSWYAAQLVERLGALQVRSDVERKRLFGYRAQAGTGSGIDTGIYTAEAGVRTYECLAGVARYIVDAGYPVIVDAAFLKRAQRARFRQLAAELGVPFVLLHFEADADTLRRRIGARLQTETDPSEAGLAVLEAQLGSQEPLRPDERDGKVAILVSQDQSLDDLVRELAGRITPPASG